MCTKKHRTWKVGDQVVMRRNGDKSPRTVLRKVPTNNWGNHGGYVEVRNNRTRRKYWFFYCEVVAAPRTTHEVW